MVVRQQPVAENGEIVAAMIDGEATVKTFRRRDRHNWLMPANPAYERALAELRAHVAPAVEVAEAARRRSRLTREQVETLL